jgi:hypothetical protein
VAADPKLRANALVLARRRRAHRRYRILVHAFAQHDRKRGVEVPPEIVKRTLAAGPEPRRMSERELERWWR